MKTLKDLNLLEVKAGFPGTADDLVENPLDLNRYVIRHKASTFFMRVEGDSMSKAGILSNDIVVVDRSISASNNCVVIAVLSEGFLVKRLKIVNGFKYLLSESEGSAKIRVDNRDDFEVWGVVTHVIRTLL